MSDTVILAPTWRANFLGLLLVLLGGLFITTLTWIVRSVADDINPLQAGFMRYAFGTLLLLPLAFKIKATDGPWNKKRLVMLQDIVYQQIGIS